MAISLAVMVGSPGTCRIFRTSATAPAAHFKRRRAPYSIFSTPLDRRSPVEAGAAAVEAVGAVDRALEADLVVEAALAEEEAAAEVAAVVVAVEAAVALARTAETAR